MADDKPTISTMQRAFARRLAGPCRVFSSAAAATNQAAVSDALTLGGDSRLLLDAAHGWNKYFCPPRPVVDASTGGVAYNVPGLGGVFVRFGEHGAAVRAMAELEGRVFDGRTVRAAWSERAVVGLIGKK